MRLTRRGRLTVTVALVTVLLATGGWLVVAHTPVGPLLGIGDGPPCTLTTGSEDLSWTSAEAMTATTVAGVGTRIGATENGIAAAVERALAGEPESAISPQAARTVYRLLPDVAQSDASSRAVARALLGGGGSALTCVTPLDDAELAVEETGSLGLTPRADAVRLAMRAVFGKQVPGWLRGGRRQRRARRGLGALRGACRRRVLPAGVGREHGRRLADRAVAGGARRTAPGRDGHLRPRDLEQRAVGAGLAHLPLSGRRHRQPRAAARGPRARRRPARRAAAGRADLRGGDLTIAPPVGQAVLGPARPRGPGTQDGSPGRCAPAAGRRC